MAQLKVETSVVMLADQKGNHLVEALAVAKGDRTAE